MIAMSDTVIVKNKPVLHYVTSITSHLQRFREVIVEAEGSNISQAIDAVEVAKRSFEKNSFIAGTEIGTVEHNGNKYSKIRIHVLVDDHEDPLFCVYWLEGYDQATRIVPLNFFSEDNGYDEETKEEIWALERGKTYILPAPMSNHGVTRIR